MNTDELMEKHRAWQHAIADQISPLLSGEGDKPGLLVARVFYAMDNGDGTVSAGQIGITPEGRESEAMQLFKSILKIMSDLDHNWRVEAVEVQRRQS